MMSALNAEKTRKRSETVVSVDEVERMCVEQMCKYIWSLGERLKSLDSIGMHVTYKKFTRGQLQHVQKLSRKTI